MVMLDTNILVYAIRHPGDAINDVLDWFGMDVQCQAISDTEAVVTLTAEPKSVEFWLRRYAEYAHMAD